MKRGVVLAVVAAVVLVLVMSASALAVPSSSAIKVSGNGTVALYGGGTARVAVYATSVGTLQHSTDPLPHWVGKAKGLVILWGNGTKALKVIGCVTRMSTMFEIARGVSIDFTFRGVPYSMYITEDYDLSGDGVWFNLLGVRTDGAPAFLSSGGFNLTYPTP
jgi:hypothetical protein